jgi:hypothetical protein
MVDFAGGSSMRALFFRGVGMVDSSKWTGP